MMIHDSKYSSLSTVTRCTSPSTFHHSAEQLDLVVEEMVRKQLIIQAGEQRFRLRPGKAR